MNIIFTPHFIGPIMLPPLPEGPAFLPALIVRMVFSLVLLVISYFAFKNTYNNSSEDEI